MKAITFSKKSNTSMDLTAAEVRLIHLFRRVNDSTQRSTLAFMDLCAEDQMLKRPNKASHLRLVAGGAC